MLQAEIVSHFLMLSWPFQTIKNTVYRTTACKNPSLLSNCLHTEQKNKLGSLLAFWATLWHQILWIKQLSLCLQLMLPMETTPNWSSFLPVPCFPHRWLWGYKSTTFSVSLMTVPLPKSSKVHLKHQLEPHNSLQLQERWLGQLCQLKRLVRSGWNTENKSQKISEHTGSLS